MKIRCIVVDDEPVALQKLKKYVEQTPYLDLVAACDTTLEALQVLADSSVDAIFTDINMLGLNGLDFVRSLAKCPLVVFITAYNEYAVDSYKIGAVDYIVKPYGLAEFQRAAERVRVQHELLQQQQAAPRQNSLFVRADYKWIHIKLDDISHIQGMSDYLRITLIDNPKPLITYATFAHILSCLPPNFMQVHRSWIVNMDHIREIDHNRIVVDKDLYIPIGDSFKEQLMLYLQGCSVGRQSKNPKN